MKDSTFRSGDSGGDCKRIEATSSGVTEEDETWNPQRVEHRLGLEEMEREEEDGIEGEEDEEEIQWE